MLSTSTWRLLLAVVVTAAKLTSKGCRLCCAGSSSGEAGSIGCGSSGATGLLGANAGRVGLGTLPLHAGSAGAAPRPCFPSGAPSLARGAHLGLISRCRRLSQDDKKLPRTWETFIYLAMIELMLKRVAGTFATSKTPSEKGLINKRLYSQGSWYITISSMEVPHPLMGKALRRLLREYFQLAWPRGLILEWSNTFRKTPLRESGQLLKHIPLSESNLEATSK